MIFRVQTQQKAFPAQKSGTQPFQWQRSVVDRQNHLPPRHTLYPIRWAQGRICFYKRKNRGGLISPTPQALTVRNQCAAVSLWRRTQRQKGEKPPPRTWANCSTLISASKGQAPAGLLLYMGKRWLGILRQYRGPAIHPAAQKPEPRPPGFLHNPPAVFSTARQGRAPNQKRPGGIAGALLFAAYFDATIVPHPKVTINHRKSQKVTGSHKFSFFAMSSSISWTKSAVRLIPLLSA